MLDMTKDELWAQYVKKNPQFNEPGSRFSMTDTGLKKLFDQTWDRAHEKGFANGKAKAEMDHPKENAFANFMQSMMGKGA